MSFLVQCQSCGGEMAKRSVARMGFFGSCACTFFIVLGVVTFFALPVFGWVVGPVVAVGAAMMMGSKRVWMCRQCRTTIPRG